MTNTPIKTELTAQQPRLFEQVAAKMRVKHYSLRTEKTYIDWIKRYIWHHGKQRRQPRYKYRVTVNIWSGLSSSHFIS
jgi:hypothetical protein